MRIRNFNKKWISIGICSKWNQKRWSSWIRSKNIDTIIILISMFMFFFFLFLYGVCLLFLCLCFVCLQCLEIYHYVTFGFCVYHLFSFNCDSSLTLNIRSLDLKLHLLIHQELHNMFKHIDERPIHRIRCISIIWISCKSLWLRKSCLSASGAEFFGGFAAKKFAAFSWATEICKRFK